MIVLRFHQERMFGVCGRAALNGRVIRPGRTGFSPSKRVTIKSLLWSPLSEKSSHARTVKAARSFILASLNAASTTSAQTAAAPSKSIIRRPAASIRTLLSISLTRIPATLPRVAHNVTVCELGSCPPKATALYCYAETAAPSSNSPLRISFPAISDRLSIFVTFVPFVVNLFLCPKNAQKKLSSSCSM